MTDSTVTLLRVDLKLLESHKTGSSLITLTFSHYATKNLFIMQIIVYTKLYLSLQ